MGPPPYVTRQLVDRPVCDAKEHRQIRERFAVQLVALATAIRDVGALPILVLPPGNEADYEPNRSILRSATTEPERVAFEKSFRAALERSDSSLEVREAAWRLLLDQHPEFAETHFQLGKVLLAQGRWEEAAEAFATARDLDALPQRFPRWMNQAYLDAAAESSAVLIDGPAVFRADHPHGQLDESLFHDGQHPTLRGYVLIARAILKELARSKAFDWPDGAPPPMFDEADCARHFGIDAEAWAAACTRTAAFFGRVAFIRHDATARVHRADTLNAAAARIRGGAAPEALGLPGIGVTPSRARN